MDSQSSKLNLEIRALESMMVQLRKLQLANASTLLNFAHRACTTIQCFWRSYQRHWTRIRNVCALALQAHGRRFLGQKKRKQIESEKKNRLERISAQSLQGAARIRISRKEAESRRRASQKIGRFGQKAALRSRNCQEKSALRIQTKCRTKIARRKTQDTRKVKEELEQLEKLEKARREKIETAQKEERLFPPLNSEDLQRMNDDEIEALCSSTSGRQQLKQAIRNINSHGPSAERLQSSELERKRRHTHFESQVKPAVAITLPPWSYSSAKKPVEFGFQKPVEEIKTTATRVQCQSPKDSTVEGNTIPLGNMENFTISSGKAGPEKKSSSFKLPSRPSPSSKAPLKKKVETKTPLVSAQRKKLNTKRKSKIDDDNHSIQRISSQLDTLFSNSGNDGTQSSKLSQTATVEASKDYTEMSTVGHDDDFEDCYDDDFE